MSTLLATRIVAVFYVLVSVLGLIQLFRPRRMPFPVVAAAMGGVAVLHLAVLVARGMAAGGLPLTNVADDLSLFAFVAASVSAAVSCRGQVPQLASLSSFIVAGLMTVSFVGGHEVHLPPGQRSGWLPVHIATAFLGNALFMMAGLTALVYLVQERRLKARGTRFRPRGSDRLPPLETLDHLTVRFIQFGFPMLTLGLLTGVIYAKQVLGTFWVWDPRNTLSLLIWLLYALLLHFRLTIGWRGRKLALLTVVGVVASLISMVGMNLAAVGVHGKDFLL